MDLVFVSVVTAVICSLGRVRAPRRGDLLLAGCGAFLVAFLLLASLYEIVRTAPVAHAWGDGALLELYTRYASQGGWQLGPYSRFGWHHPGPLLFYLLAPLYVASESHALALNAGALAINSAALGVIAWAAVRWASAATGCALLLAAALYLFRVGEITISYWNPYVVVLPLGALIVLSARLLAGWPAALPLVVVAGSFLMQTHVSLVPCVMTITAVSLRGLIAAGANFSSEVVGRSRLRWIIVSVGVLAVVWSLPIAEELGNRPGNLSKLVRFFMETGTREPWTTALRAWAQGVSAVGRGDLEVPVGAQVQLSDGLAGLGPALGQLLALFVASWDARRRGDRFHASLSFVGAAASLVALWSMTQIRGPIFDYVVFWVSIVGTLNWAALAGMALVRLQAILHPQAARRVQALTVALAISVVTGFLAGELARFRRNAHVREEGVPATVAALTHAIREHIAREGIHRPLLQVSPGVWSEAAGVAVALYKQGIQVTVEGEWVVLFGRPLAPTGREDALLYIADAPFHDELSRRSRSVLVTRAGAVYVHVEPIAVGP